MAITAQLCRASAEECRRRAGVSIDAVARAAYQELVRAWLLLADTAEQVDEAAPDCGGKTYCEGRPEFAAPRAAAGRAAL